jgi:hypothetical protein
MPRTPDSFPAAGDSPPRGAARTTRTAERRGVTRIARRGAIEPVRPVEPEEAGTDGPGGWPTGAGAAEPGGRAAGRERQQTAPVIGCSLQGPTGPYPPP